MKLSLAIIHMDMVVDTLELNPQDYSLGRSQENNIVVQHFSLRPEHGRVFFEEGRWFYQDLETDERKHIGDREAVSVSDQIQLATATYVENSETHIPIFANLRGAHQAKLNKRLAIAVASLACLMMMTFVGYRQFSPGGVAGIESNLINRVRDKIVEFEANPDSRAIEQLRQYGGLTDADFKESSGFCTGFLVGPNIVLTAAHCLMGRMVIDINNDFYLKTSDGQKHRISRVLGFDVKRDFLFLETEGMEAYGHLNFAPQYNVEQKVFTVGNVHGQGIAIRDGIISGETADPDDPEITFLRYSAGTSPGNSGGPLVDRNGDVVALVFASTYSENYNLGTASEVLQEAYDQYVDGREEPKEIEIAMKRVLNFKAPLMLQALSLPYLPQFDDYPEIAKKFNEVKIAVEVPTDFETIDESVLGPLNTAVQEAFMDVQKMMKERNEIVLDWKSFVSSKTPAILPSQFDQSQNNFIKINNRYYPLLAGLIDSPSKPDFTKYKKQLEKEKKFDFQAYGYNIHVSDEKVDLLKSDVFYKPKDVTGSKLRLQNLSYGTPYSQLLVFGNDDLRTLGFFGMKLLLKNFIGQTGVLANSASRFVRPQSIRDFTLKKLEISNEDIKTEAVKDRVGRTWRRSHLKIFEAMNVYTYCLDLPTGTHCVARVLSVYNDYALKVIEENFRRYILSHLLMNPYFWDRDALIGFISNGKAKQIPLMDGVRLQKMGSVIKGSLKGFPLSFEIPDANQVESLRLQTGLYGDDKNADWVGYGVEWVHREKNKDMVCGLGLEAFQSQSTFILNFLRDRRKQEKLKKIKGEDAKPLPGVWYRPFRGLKRPFQIYGYCAPLEEDPRIANQYFVDFKNSKPLKYKHVIGQ